MNITVTFRKVRSAQPCGEYKPTAVDAAKAAADFRIVAMGKKATIYWRDGRIEHVTEKQLEKLQQGHSWACDF